MWKLDRLGRSVKDLVAIVCELEQRGIHFKSQTDQIDTSTTADRFFLHVMASLVQIERDLTAERTRAGLKAARRQGRTRGRKRKMDDSKIAAAKPGGVDTNVISVVTSIPVPVRTNSDANHRSVYT